MSRKGESDPPSNVVKFPVQLQKVEQPVVGEDGQYRLTEISKGGWTSWEHMVSDLGHSVASGDLEPLGMVMIVFDRNVGTLLLRRDVTAAQLQLFLQEYLEAEDRGDLA